MLWLIATIGTTIFSEITQRWSDSFGAIIGYKLLLLTILALIATVVALLIHNRSEESLVPLPPTAGKLSEKEIRAKREHLLKNLSDDEKILLRRYIDGKTKTLKLGLYNGTATGLVSQGILFTSSSFSIDFDANFNLSNWAWEILKDNPKFLK